MAYYINHQLKRKIASLAKGSSISNVYNSDLKRLEIPLPLLKEQEKIANILTTWDDAISKQDELIKDKEELKKGLMQKLLSGEIRFDGFFDEWEIKKLSIICQIKKGQQLNKSTLFDIGEYPAINGGINPSGYTNTYNTNENTITISEGGNSCGYVNYITTKFWSGGHCYSLLNLKINSYFLYQYLKLNELKIMKLRVGSGLPNIQKGDIENFKINVPPLEEQQKIAEVLSNADKEIDLLKNELQELKEQKKGLMQKLLTGEVRVKV
jgi:type I restriction enzyme S subunit